MGLLEKDFPLLKIIPYERIQSANIGGEAYRKVSSFDQRRNEEAAAIEINFRNETMRNRLRLTSIIHFAFNCQARPLKVT